MGTPKINPKKLGTPQFGYEKNVNIQYPLDADARVEVGGELINRLVIAFDNIRETNEKILEKLEILVLHQECATNEVFTEEDIENGDS
jgi:hypothetical protein